MHSARLLPKLAIQVEILIVLAIVRLTQRIVVVGGGVLGTSTTKAGSTNLGYTDLAASSRRGIHQAPMTASAPQIAPPSVNADTDAQGGLGPIGEALQKHFSPEARASRNEQFQTGRTSSRWPGGTAEDAAEGLGADAAEGLTWTAEVL